MKPLGRKFAPVFCYIFFAKKINKRRNYEDLVFEKHLNGA
jgi:hypothetical protein